MKFEVLKKGIEINAPKEKVWDVLVQDTYNRRWYAEFSEGSYAETDWKVGSKTKFLDATGSGMVSEVIVNKPFEALAVENKGVVIDSNEIYNGGEAEVWKGSTESYRIIENGGKTTLQVQTELPPKYINDFSILWDNALQVVKQLAEEN